MSLDLSLRSTATVSSDRSGDAIVREGNAIIFLHDLFQSVAFDVLVKKVRLIVPL